MALATAYCAAARLITQTSKSSHIPSTTSCVYSMSFQINCQIKDSVICIVYFACAVKQFRLHSWAARYNTWLLIKLTTKGVVFSFLLDCILNAWCLCTLILNQLCMHCRQSQEQQLICISSNGPGCAERYGIFSQCRPHGSLFHQPHPHHPPCCCRHLAGQLLSILCAWFLTLGFCIFCACCWCVFFLCANTSRLCVRYQLVPGHHEMCSANRYAAHLMVCLILLLFSSVLSAMLCCAVAITT